MGYSLWSNQEAPSGCWWFVLFPVFLVLVVVGIVFSLVKVVYDWLRKTPRLSRQLLQRTEVD